MASSPPARHGASTTTTPRIDNNNPTVTEKALREAATTRGECGSQYDGVVSMNN
jgi:hypothetical protein